MRLDYKRQPQELLINIYCLRIELKSTIFNDRLVVEIVGEFLLQMIERIRQVLGIV